MEQGLERPTKASYVDREALMKRWGRVEWVLVEEPLILKPVGEQLSSQMSRETHLWWNSTKQEVFPTVPDLEVEALVSSSKHQTSDSNTRLPTARTISPTCKISTKQRQGFLTVRAKSASIRKIWSPMCIWSHWTTRHPLNSSSQAKVQQLESKKSWRTTKCNSITGNRERRSMELLLCLSRKSNSPKSSSHRFY